MAPRKVSPFTLLLVAPLLATACGDDESTSPSPTESDDAGADADAPSTTTTQVTSASSSEPLSSSSASPNDCATITTTCVGKDDVDGLGNLCLRVGASDNAEQCASLAAECESFCGAGEAPSLDGGNIDVETCKAMGDTCHDFDEGAGLGHLCHEVGHGGNLTWCGAIFDECVSLCGEPAVHHEDHDASDASDASATQSFTIQFAAKVGERDFACGEQYANFGSANSVVTPQDLRFYVSGIRLVTQAGEQVPVTVDEVAPFQGGGVALLDFEDSAGDCRNDSPETNTAVAVTAPAGDYTGIAFSTSVPANLNHANPLTAPTPLAPGAMNWGWLLGYKFIKAEFLQVLPIVGNETDSLDAATSPVADAGAPIDLDAATPIPGVGIFHLGSTGCTNVIGPDAGANQFDVECSKSSFNDIVLDGFNPQTNVVTFDLAQVFAGSDLSTMSMCHGEGASCPSLFESVGLDFQTGSAQTPYAAFGVE